VSTRNWSHACGDAAHATPHHLATLATQRVRYGLPATLLIAGLVVLLVDTDSRRFEGFAMLVGSGLSVALTSVLFRLSASDEREREDEDHAREYLAQHGYWPDEARDHEDHQDQEGAGDACRE
jgi:hypothetical protein